VDYDHATIVNFLKEEVNALVRVPFEKQPIKKRMNVSRSGISKFIFFCKKPIYKG
jgi:hypothetical protein